LENVLHRESSSKTMLTVARVGGIVSRKEFKLGDLFLRTLLKESDFT